MNAYKKNVECYYGLGTIRSLCLEKHEKIAAKWIKIIKKAQL